MNSRPHPFDLLFGEFRAARFPAIRDDLGDRAGIDDFLLSAPALELMRDIRPDEGLGDSVDEYVALLHAAYRFWRDGECVLTAGDATTRDLLAGRGAEGLASPLAHYLQIAPRLIWGRLVEEAPFEPLDGWFAVPEGALLRVVACFGLHPDRPGVSVVAAQGEAPPAGLLHRPDGSDLFAPTMPGADAAGLAVVAAPEELLVLAWRAQLEKEGG